MRVNGRTMLDMARAHTTGLRLALSMSVHGRRVEWRELVNSSMLTTNM